MSLSALSPNVLICLSLFTVNTELKKLGGWGSFVGYKYRRALGVWLFGCRFVSREELGRLRVQVFMGWVIMDFGRKRHEAGAGVFSVRAIDVIEFDYDCVSSSH